ncbi:MAG: hypothetical protein O3B86_17740, partial [Planctomycetota bacterium]|nr:hypothetical protein [Planctomycetota bacterium]
ARDEGMKPRRVLGARRRTRVWSLGYWQLNQWLFTLVEQSYWNTQPSVLRDRNDRPWASASRRSSHTDRRDRIAREMLENEFLTSLPAIADKQRFRTLSPALSASTCEATASSASP